MSCTVTPILSSGKCVGKCLRESLWASVRVGVCEISDRKEV